MKKCFVISMLLLSGLALAETPTTGPTTAPTTQSTSFTDDASYGIGYEFGKQIAQARVKLNIEALSTGLRDAIGGEKSKITADVFRDAMMKLQKEATESAVKASADFREANGKKKGVTTTASGLQIETITEGTGASPKASDTVKVHYTGTLIDGTKFDSSVDRGKPAMFEVGGVIPGWTEGLQLMKVGGKARLVIPPSGGYGEEGQGPIPPNSTLVFEVELLSIEKPQAQP